MKREGITVDTSLISMNFLEQIRYMRENYRGPFIIHAHLPRAELLARLSKSKVGFYITRHNAENFFPNSIRFLSIILSRFVLRKSHGVICISRAVRQFILDSHEISRSIPTSVIYYGYERRMGNFVRHSTENASLDRTIELSTIGRLTPQKNLTLMINFAYRLKLEGINFKLQIVGEGPDRYKLEKKVTDLQLTQEIHFLGKLSEVSQFLTSSDFFIFTSNYEGLGLALLEAMDAGLPIVAPRNSAIPEVLGEDHPGLFVSGDLESLYATFMRFLLDPSLQQQVVDIQASRLKQFDMQSYFWNHHKFYGLS